MTKPGFAADRATRDYYDRRAQEYDDWYTGQGLFSERDRPGWEVEVDQVVQLLGSLPSARTLDVACGTGFMTRHVPAVVVGVDQSPAMVTIARSRLRGGLAIVGDALHLGVADGAFDRVLTGHFYGHLPLDERETFLNEAHRVASELVVIDSARRPGVGAEEWQERVLNDGSRHRVYKRYLTGDQLAEEIGGQKLLNGRWFVGARACWDGHHQSCETEPSLPL